MKRAAGADRTCRSLVRAIREGFSEKKRMVGEDLRVFYSMKEELYELEEVPFLHGHMLIPEMLRKHVLDKWGGTQQVLDAHPGWEVESVQIEGEL